MCKKKLYPYFKWGGMIIIFAISLYAAYSISMVHAPDEELRYQIPYFILKNGYLPFGTEDAVRSAEWGFSYGFTPYLPSLLSAIFMKIASYFSVNESMILLSCRMVNVCAASLTWMVCCMIGERIFKKTSSIVLLALLVTFLPQFIFLSSYTNNDAFTVMISGFIIYYWIKGTQDRWKIKDCIRLGIWIGACALTYYNAYGFILCSIIYFFFDVIKKRMTLHEIGIRAAIIFFSGFTVAGWFFIRNLINHGDFFGMKIQAEIGEKLAVSWRKPSLRNTPKNIGISFSEAFLGTYYMSINWFESTVKSFIGNFGYLKYPLSNFVYATYSVIYFIGFFSGIYYEFVKRKNKIKLYKNLVINLILCIIIPIGLSMYYSYAIDYQAQGRYCISALLPIMIIIVYGYERLFAYRIGKFDLRKLTVGIMTIYIGLFIYSYQFVMLKNCKDSTSYVSPMMTEIIEKYY